MMGRGGRWVRGIGLAVSLVWLLARGYADYLARPSPERALALNATQPEALVRGADRALVAGVLDEAAVMAEAALRTQPFEGRAFRILGAVAELRGDHERATTLMHMAVATTPRESAAQFWLAINALADKDVNGALQRLDRLLRIEPEIQWDVFPILATIAVNPVGARPVAALLAMDVPWRPEFMIRVMREAESSADLARLFRAIEAAGGSITADELDQFATRLLANREWRQLRRLVKTLATGSDAYGLHDGGFDGVGRGPLLGWSVGKVPGADVVPSAPLGDGNRALRLIFHDRRVPFRHVSQTLLLAPGRYQLAGRARAIDLRAALGLAWSLSCVDNRASLGKSDHILGTHDWRSFSVAFEVPESACGGQLLELVLEARIAAEQQVAGEVWFDDLKIERIVEPAATSAVNRTTVEEDLSLTLYPDNLQFAVF